MTERFTGWLIVSLGVILQFLGEVTLGRTLAAPAILVPLLVYMGLNTSSYWTLEGALWSGFALDLLLHQTPGTSSLAMLLGLWLSDSILRITTGAVRMTFLAHALLASLIADILFILFAAAPPGSGFSRETLLIIPRILVPLAVYQLFPMVFAGRTRGSTR